MCVKFERACVRHFLRRVHHATGDPQIPPVQRHGTSPLCFPVQVDRSKNDILFNGSQQPSFLLCLATLCVSVRVCSHVWALVVLHIAINRNCRDADEDAEGVYFLKGFVPIHSQQPCFITHLWCGGPASYHTLLPDLHTYTHSLSASLKTCSIKMIL